MLTKVSRLHHKSKKYLFTCLLVSFTQSVQQSEKEKNDQSNIWSSQKTKQVFFLCEMDISHYLHSVTVIIP